MARSPRLTVVSNGIKTHENQTSATPSVDAGRPDSTSDPLCIQGHGNLVYYRSIWIEELPDTQE